MPTLKTLSQQFLASKKADVDSFELSPRTYAEYCRAVTALCNTLGPDREFGTLGPVDFEQLYRALAPTRGILALARDITMIRTACKYFVESLDAPSVKFGLKFKAPGQLARRKHRNKLREERGARMFQPCELRGLIANAPRSLKAMILLGLNAGFGNTDCAYLPTKAIDFETGWLSFPRHKTAVERRIPLWEETRRALWDCKQVRHKPRAPEHATLLFINPAGKPCITTQLKREGVISIYDGVSVAFRCLLNCLDLYRPGRSFYTLRHIFETVASETKDQVAVDAIMGRADNSMAAAYREHIGDDRLLSVTRHVHSWLLSGSPRSLKS